MNVLNGLAFSSGLMPHGFCYQWKPSLIWLHAISDTLIALAYFLIPMALIYFVRKRRDLPFGWMFICFGAFITACGLTHVMEVWTLWVPVYWLSGGVKLITVLASVPTAIFLVRSVPEALALPSPEEMRTTIEQLEQQKATLKKSEERFRQMAENIQEIFWTMDPETKAATYASPAFEQICELPLDSLYSNPSVYMELIHPEDRQRVMVGLEKLVGTNRFDEEFRIICPSGSTKWLRGIGFVARDSMGKVITLLGTAQEITARKELEIHLRENEDRYRDLVENSTDLICTYNLEGRLLSLNESPAKLLGYSREELLNMPLRNIVLPEARTQFDESLLTIQRDGFVKGSMVVVTKTGEQRIWEYHNTLRTEGVTVPVVRGMAHDITDRKLLERALRHSEEKFAKAFHSSPVEITISTLLEDLFMDVNTAFERNSGFTRDEVLGHTSMELGMWNDPGDRAKLIEEIVKQGRLQDREVRFRTKSGKTRVTLYSAEQIKIGGKQCLLSVCEDITLRKEIEEALRVSEEKFSKAFRSSPSIISICTLKEGVFLDVNESFEKQTGFARHELLGRTALDTRLWADPGELDALVAEVENRGFVRDQEVHFRARSGQVAILQISVELLELQGEECLLTVGQDITNRKRAEATLRNVEEQFSAILTHSPNLIFLKDIEGRYLLINKEYRKTFRFTQEQIIGKKDIEVFPPDQAAAFCESDLQVRQARAPMEFEEVMLHEDGPHTSIVQKFPLFDAKGEIYAICGFVTDITERKRAAEELRRISSQFLSLQDEERRRIAQNLHDSTGQNLVALATMIGQLSRPGLLDARKSRKLLSECKALADRCIREVRTLSYTLYPAALDGIGLVGAIRDYVRGFSKRSGIHVDLEMSSSLARMERDIELALFRVVQEGLTNIQCHSGSQKAKIRIERDSNLALEISDFGHGIMPNQKKKARSHIEFGVGISSMRERMRLIGGRLEIDSNCQGTRLLVTIPLEGTRA
jgi:PAS domain S-box-containing protein